MRKRESLTEHEQQALQHMRKAQELGTTLKEYASRFGLDVQQLYQLRKPPGAQRCARADPQPSQGAMDSG